MSPIIRRHSFWAFFKNSVSGTEDIIAILRKWDKKEAVLIVSNLSPNNHTINLMVDGGLMSNNKPSKKAKVW